MARGSRALFFCLALAGCGKDHPTRPRLQLLSTLGTTFRWGIGRTSTTPITDTTAWVSFGVLEPSDANYPSHFVFRNAAITPATGKRVFVARVSSDTNAVVAAALLLNGVPNRVHVGMTSGMGYGYSNLSSEWQAFRRDTAAAGQVDLCGATIEEIRLVADTCYTSYSSGEYRWQTTFHFELLGYGTPKPPALAARAR